MGRSRSVLFRLCVVAAAVLAGGTRALLGLCGPFADVTDPAFCTSVLEIFTLGITTGTTPATYDPTSSVTRIQMAIFLSREADRVLQRGGRRAALDQFWTPKDDRALRGPTIGIGAALVRSDGESLWAASQFGGVSRVRARDGALLGVLGATQPYGVVVGAGQVFVTGLTTPGKLYRIDPRSVPGTISTVATNLGDFPYQGAYDGSRIWTANDASLSIVTPGASLPWTVTTVTTGFTQLRGALYDGTNVWVTDSNFGSLVKLDGSGAILQSVTIGDAPRFPVFDGTNIWVPSLVGPSVSVVRAATGDVLATLTGNGMSSPFTAAFDGQRILVTNNNGNSVSLWKAADLTPLGNFSTGANSDPVGACSDGVNFWITLNGSPARLVRF